MTGLFAATVAKAENVGNGPGVICTNANADRGRSIATGMTLGGSAIGGSVVSNTTRSGSLSSELILIAGRSMLAWVGSTTELGSSQLATSSNSRSAGPATP